MIEKFVLDANPIKKRNAVPEFPASKTFLGRENPEIPGPSIINLS